MVGAENMWKKAFMSALLLLLLSHCGQGVSAQENTAHVYGTVYDWFTLEPLEGVVVEVTEASGISTQRMVASDGTYEFDVELGDYVLRASYYESGVLIYLTEENLSVGLPGEYHFDLILFPTLEENLIPENGVIPEIETPESGSWTGLAGAILVFGGIGAFAAYFKFRKRPRKISKPTPIRVVGLPEDLAAVISLIRRHGGRMRQRDLRRELSCSEAKVSLMLADLEARGLVRKIKRGRSNIVVLSEL